MGHVQKLKLEAKSDANETCFFLAVIFCRFVVVGFQSKCHFFEGLPDIGICRRITEDVAMPSISQADPPVAPIAAPVAAPVIAPLCDRNASAAPEPAPPEAASVEAQHHQVRSE